MHELWSPGFFSVLAAMMLLVIMALGFWFYIGSDKDTGTALIIVGLLYYGGIAYAKYVVAANPDASIAMYFLAHLDTLYLYAGFVGGMVVGLVGGGLRRAYKRRYGH